MQKMPHQKNPSRPRFLPLLGQGDVDQVLVVIDMSESVQRIQGDPESSLAVTQSQMVLGKHHIGEMGQRQNGGEPERKKK